MTNYFWVGGAGNIDNVGTTHIAIVSGGPGGFGPVTSSDSLTIDSNSGSANYSAGLSSGFACTDLNIGAPSAGTLTLSGSGTATLSGILNVTSSSGISITYSGTFNFTSTATGKTITSNGISFAATSMTFNGVGGGWTLGSAINISGGALTVTNGSFSDGGFNVTANTHALSNSNARSVNRSGIWTLVGAGTVYSCATSTNLTLTDTGTVNCTNSSASAMIISPGTTSGVAIANLKVSASSGALALTATNFFNKIDLTGYTGALTNTALTVLGSVTFGIGMTMGSASNTWNFSGASGTQILTTNGVTFGAGINLSNTGSGVQLGSALSTTQTVTQTQGGFDDKGFNITGTFYSSNNSNTRTTNRASIWAFSGVGATYSCSGTGLTLNDTGTVKFTDQSASSKTFAGGSKAYNILYFAGGGGTGAYIITGANTFAQINADPSTAIQTFTFPASVTNRLTSANLNISGNASFQNVLNSSSSGTKATISCSSGVISLAYVSVKDSAATGGANFQAYSDTNGCVNTSDNTGWIFFGVAGTGAGIAAAPKGSGSGHLDESGSGVGICGPPRASGTGTLDEAGSGVGLARAPTATGSGHLDEAGSGIGIAPAPIASGSGADVPGSIDPSRIVFARPRRAAVIAE